MRGTTALFMAIKVTNPIMSLASNTVKVVFIVTVTLFVMSITTKEIQIDYYIC